MGLEATWESMAASAALIVLSRPNRKEVSFSWLGELGSAVEVGSGVGLFRPV